MLPLVAPALVTTGLLAFITAWNEFLFALSFTQTTGQAHGPGCDRQASLGSREALSTPWGQIMAATVIVTVAADRADARPTAPDPRRAHRRRGQGVGRRLVPRAGPRLGVEEVEAARVDRELDVAAFGDLRLRVDPRDEPCSALRGCSSGRAQYGIALLGDVGDHSRGRDGEVDEDVGTERLRVVAPGPDAPSSAGIRPIRLASSRSSGRSRE